MPNILLHFPALNIGGAELSVLRLTRLLVDQGWQVELVLTSGGGNLEHQIDPRVKVSHLRNKSSGNSFISAKGITNKLKHLDDFFSYFYYFLQGLLRSISYRFKKYDAAICSLTGMSPAFCCRWVQAGKRLQWIRTDLRHCDQHDKVSRNIHKFHRQIDAYVCVSNTAYESLVTLFPEVKEKALVLYNVIDAQGMRDSVIGTGDPFKIYSAGLKVVTVCRLLDKAKGLFRMLAIHKRLHDEGIDFYWFVVGDGPDRQRLEESIRQCGMEHRFILVGRRENPFPYYQHANIVATLSYYEGLCGSVNEAKVLGKAVIATEFSGIREQITDGENGIIVGNDEESIYQGMKRLLTDAALRAQLTNDSLPRSIIDDGYKLEVLEQLLIPGRAKL